MPMPSTNGVEVSPDPQFEKPQRRRFSAEQKLRILKQVDACSDRGEIAVILRREGLYSSHLVAWRRQRDAAARQGLEPKTAGRKPIHDAKDREIARLVNRQAQLERELELSRKIVEFQKKAHEILQHVSVPGEKR
jgi:transposase-like protein